MSLSAVFSALSDETRHSILHLLKKKDMKAGEIASHFSISGPSISHHLSILKEAGLTTSRRKGQEIIYSLNLSAFEEAADAVVSFIKKHKHKS